MNKLNEMLQKAQQERFWGSIQIDFQEGAVVLIRRTETFKPKVENNSANARHNS